MKRLLAISLFLSFLFSCKDDGEDLAPDFEGYQYFPLEVGQTSIFKIDSVAYDDFTQEVDTFSYFLKEEVGSTFLDGANRKAFKVNIYTSSDSTNWRLQKVISKLRLDLRAEIAEDNISIVPMVFPIKETAVWDLNILNTKEEIRCRFKGINQPFRDYNTTVTVAQEEEISLIERKTSEEVYAENLGLVYSRKQDLVLDFSTSEIRSGFDVERSLLSYQ